MSTSHLRHVGALHLVVFALTWSGCGRIGLTLLPLDKSYGSSGDGGDDSGELDGGSTSTPGGDGDGDTVGDGDGDTVGDGDGDVVGDADGGLVGDGDGDVAPTMCELDSDGDGSFDCDDGCPNDANKVTAGLCGCGTPDTDSDGDGEPDCTDICTGTDDPGYVSDASCGVGYCRTHNTPSRCVSGSEVACKPGNPLSASDTTCDGVDDDCDGTADDDYSNTNLCGVGYCRTQSTPASCSNGSVVACQPGAPLSSNDATADGVDDDCDNAIDEDACVPFVEKRGYGTFTLTPGACKTITVKLWGGAGAAGGDGGNWGATINNGTGGAGGYASGTFTVNASSSIVLNVGQGGRGCSTAGVNPITTYNGGNGGVNRTQAGVKGADGVQVGGAAGDPSTGAAGGAGSFGGGGGGAGSGGLGYGPYGGGGGGGAASVIVVDGVRMVAGGGGGGGGVGTDITTAGHSGGNGGTGCSGKGLVSDQQGGGGGGGGACIGASVTQTGSGMTPFADPDLPAGSALGGSQSGECGAGGNGYAIVSFGP